MKHTFDVSHILYLESPPTFDTLTPDSQDLCSTILQHWPYLELLFPQQNLTALCFVSQDSVLCNVNMITNESMCYFSSGHKLHFNRHFPEFVLTKGVHRRQQIPLVGYSLKSHPTVLFLSVEFVFQHFVPSLIMPLIV